MGFGASGNFSSGAGFGGNSGNLGNSQGGFGGGGVPAGANNNTVAVPGQEDGDLFTYNGTAWTRLPAGNQYQFLNVKDGVPSWTSFTPGEIILAAAPGWQGVATGSLSFYDPNGTLGAPGWVPLDPPAVYVNSLLAVNNAGGTFTLPQWVYAANKSDIYFGDPTTTLNTNDIFHWDNTNYRLGVGTGYPTQTLQVSGNARITGNIYDSNNNPGLANSVLASTGSGIVWLPSVPGSGGSFTGSISSGQIAFGYGTNAITGASSLYYNSVSGFLGLNTASPLQALHLVGSAKITGAIYDSNNNPGLANSVLSSTGTGLAWIAAPVGGGGSIGGNISSGLIAFGYGTNTIAGASNLYYTSGIGSLGVGTNSPTQSLHIQGSARVTGAIYDNFNKAGLANSFLISTGTGISWTSTLPNLVKLVNSPGAYSGVSTGSIPIYDPYGVLNGTAGWASLDIPAVTANLILTANNGMGTFNFPQWTYASDVSSIYFGDPDIVFNTSNNLYWDNTNNRLGVGTQIPLYSLHVAGNSKLSGAFYDSNNNPGLANSVLSSTGSGVAWVAAPTGLGGSLFGTVSPGQITFGLSSNTVTSVSSLVYSTGVGSLGVGTNLPTQTLHIAGSARLTKSLYDSNNNPGLANSVLSSTGTGIAWAAPGAAVSSLYGAINVQSYGAVADGITGVATAVQNALNALVSGGELVFPSGVYYFDTGVTWHGNNNSSLVVRGVGQVVFVRDFTNMGLFNATGALMQANGVSTLLDDTSGIIINSITNGVNTTWGGEPDNSIFPSCQIGLATNVTLPRGTIVKVVADNMLAGSRKQTITLTLVSSVTYNLTVNGQTTVNLTQTNTSSDIQTALQNLSTVGIGSANVTGSNPFTIYFNYNVRPNTSYNVVANKVSGLGSASISDTGTMRAGETAMVAVGASNTSTIYLGSYIRTWLDSYATNPRLFIYGNSSVLFDNIIFDCTPSDYTSKNVNNVIDSGWNDGYVNNKYLVNPIIQNIRTVKSAGPQLTIQACVGSHLHNCSLKNARNSSSTGGSYGYAILPNCSSHTLITNCVIERARNGFTDSSSQIPAAQNNTNLYLYGRPEYTTMTNCNAIGIEDAAFDTHETSWCTNFTNCTSYGAPNFPGFKARGFYTEFNSCIDYGSQGSFTINSARGATLNNCVSYNAKSTAFQIFCLIADGAHAEFGDGANQRDIYLNGCSVFNEKMIKSSASFLNIYNNAGGTTFARVNNFVGKIYQAGNIKPDNSTPISLQSSSVIVNNLYADLIGLNTTVTLFYIENSSLDISGSKAYFNGTLAATPNVYFALTAGISTIKLDNLYLSYQNCTTPYSAFVQPYSNTATTITGDKLTIDTTNGSLGRFIWGNNNASAKINFAVTNLQFIGSSPVYWYYQATRVGYSSIYASWNNNLGVSSTRNNMSSWFTQKPINNFWLKTAPIPNAYISQLDDQSAGLPGPIDIAVTIVLEATDASYISTTVSAPYRSGQTFTIINKSNFSQYLTGAGGTLPVNYQRTIYYDGSSWVNQGQDTSVIQNTVATYSSTAGISTSDSQVLLANTTSSVFTLPDATIIPGKTIQIQRTTATGTATIQGYNSQTIDGRASIQLNTQYACITAVSNGVNWTVDSVKTGQVSAII